MAEWADFCKGCAVVVGPVPGLCSDIGGFESTVCLFQCQLRFQSGGLMLLDVGMGAAQSVGFSSAQRAKVASVPEAWWKYLAQTSGADSIASVAAAKALSLQFTC